MLEVYVDADACPVKEEVYRVAGRYGLKVLVVSNGWLRVRGIPIFFTPYFRHSLQRLPRASGFLTPHFSNSNVKGFIFEEDYFWAINKFSVPTKTKRRRFMMAIQLICV